MVVPMSSAPAATLPLVHSFEPATFMERGAAIPFTTPALLGARGRPGERGTFDFLVPNPAGGRGTYILGWDAIGQLCRPTVHDTRLGVRLAALAAITPSEIRRAARAVLAEGLAGRAAKAAASAAEADDRRDALAANFLLLSLLERLVPGSATATPLAGITDPVEIAHRGRLALAHAASPLRMAPDQVGDALEALAGAFAPIGLRGQTPPVRIARLLIALRRLHEDARSWAARPGAVHPDLARLVAAAAQVTLLAASYALAAAQDMTADMIALLRRWSHAPGDVAARLARPEWLLDGWEPIGLIWAGATTEAARIEALVEIAPMVPILPREAAVWMDGAIEPDTIARFRKTVLLNQDWRTGQMLDRVARNECLRALAA